MPCDTRRRETQEEREFREALSELDALIACGKLKIVRDSAGRIAITGWESTRASRAGWCDGCAVRELEARGSLGTQRAIAACGVRREGEFFLGHSRQSVLRGQKDHKH